MATCPNCGAPDCPCALLRPDQNCERRRAEAAERERDQARGAVLRAGRDPKWAALYAWLDDHRDEAVKTISDTNGRLELERDAALQRATEAEARADALAEALRVIRSHVERLPLQFGDAIRRASVVAQADAALAAHRRGA